MVLWVWKNGRGEFARPAEGKNDLRGARGGRADSLWPKSWSLDAAELAGTYKQCTFASSGSAVDGKETR